MPLTRGDVVLTFVENVGSVGGKLRPALVVQSDVLNARIRETIIAAITSNTTRVHEPHQVLVELSTDDGAASGLLYDSAIRCERLHTVPQSDVRRTIGHLSESMMEQVDKCLRSALNIRS